MKPSLSLGYFCWACSHFYERWPGSPRCTECGAIAVQTGMPPQAGGDSPVRFLGDGGESLLERRLTGVGPIDHVLQDAKGNRGSVPGQATLMLGEPSGGKTSLLLVLLSRAPKPLFATLEMGEAAVIARAEAIQIQDFRRIRFTTEAELGALEKIVLAEEPSDLVIDSLPHVYDGRRGSPGTVWTTEEASRRLFQIAHSLGVSVWCVNHINAKGKSRGSVTVPHNFDVVLKVSVNKRTKPWIRTLECTKNRTGVTGLSAMIPNDETAEDEHDADGKTPSQA